MIHAGKPLDSGELKNNRFGYRVALSIGNIKRARRLEREASVVLKIEASAEFPGQLVSAVHLEYVSGIQIQVVVLPVDVEVRIGEIVEVCLI